MSRFFGRLFQGRRPGQSGEPGRLAAEVVRLYEKGRYADAESAARRLVDLQRDMVGRNHPDYATALSNLGLLIQKRGDLVAAEGVLAEALVVRKAALGERHRLYAASLNHLAELRQLRGDLDAAEPPLREALEILKKTAGEHHPDYATGLTSLALVRHRRGDHATAESLLREALAIREKSLGERHPQYATALSNLALILQRRGDRAGAEPLLRRALEVRKAAYGQQHPDYAASLGHLALLLIERGDLAGAEPLLKRSIAIREPLLGAQHPEVRSDRAALERLRAARGRPEPKPATITVPVAPASHAGAPEPNAPSDAPAVPIPGLPPRSTASNGAPTVPIPGAGAVGGNGSRGRRSGAAVPARVDMGERPPARPPAELVGTLRTLSNHFEDVAARLEEQARRMLEAGVPPELAPIEEAAACGATLHGLEAELELQLEAFGRDELLDVPATLEPPRSLRVALVAAEALERAQNRREEREATRREAMALIERAMTLTHRDPRDGATVLQPLRSTAEGLRLRIAETPATGPLPPEAAAVAEGSHPLGAVLRLSEAGPDLPDQEWSGLYRAVAETFGRSVAAAAARKRLVPAEKAG